MTTLLELRLKLNGELGVINDADTTPWSQIVRNNAISDGYAALWRVGVWKDVVQDLAAVTDQRDYGLTSIRRLDRLDLLDSSGLFMGKRAGTVVPTGTGTGAAQLRLSFNTGTGTTIRVYGWTAYRSDFGQNDLAVDDLPAEYNRVPLLKAKAICQRAALSRFGDYGQKQLGPPEMSLTIDQFLGLIAATEREFEEEAKALAGLRPRSGQARRS